ncbi:hypothetical protein [Rubellicoccus peritrichatus]|uniref:Peptidase S54 rhomboid domain-containing protein n=1 Tax=Rubellicoccus peritrichatus TaxID=3080537 RepID=A0AAQ3QUW6_9BACT|nr:hypothetical protein [Puniceicoccus sp. CR14]WOO42856.1 hypothetical protein RZN69_07105 [Puniceicoccus sp. CR14]
MTWLDKLEKRFGRIAIPNLIYWIVLSQVLFYGLGLFTTFPVEALTLQPSEIFKGQVWRLLTFLFVPEIRVLSFWVIFAWYLLFIYGQALEGEWGEFRFNLFVFIGTAATAIAAMVGYLIQPFIGEVPTTYLFFSIFLAFAARNPNFELLLFFVLPVKVKWLAWLTWGILALTFITGSLATKLVVVAACVNLLLFFGKSLFTSVKATQRRKAFERERAVEAEEPFHRCVICGLTDKDDPDMDFVYDSGNGYCEKHAYLVDATPEEREAAKKAAAQ